MQYVTRRRLFSRKHITRWLTRFFSSMLFGVLRWNRRVKKAGEFDKTSKKRNSENLKLLLKDPVSHQHNHRLLIHQELNSTLCFTSAEHCPWARLWWFNLFYSPIFKSESNSISYQRCKPDPLWLHYNAAPPSGYGKTHSGYFTYSILQGHLFLNSLWWLVFTAAAITAMDAFNNSCYFSNRRDISNMEHLELCISAFSEGAMCMFIFYDL